MEARGGQAAARGSGSATRQAPRGGDGDFRGAVVFAAGFAGAALLTYMFNAMLGRRLSSSDFATFAALLGVLLAVNGPSSALFGGGAMASARSGEVPRTPWRGALITCAIVGTALGLAPVGSMFRSVGWFLASASMLMLVAWARGLLIGLGRLGTAGATMLFEGAARIVFASVLLGAGLQLAGASAGLALGVAAGLLVTKLLLPRHRLGTARAIPTEVWLSIVGLAFVGLVQFVDVVAVRVAGGPP